MQDARGERLTVKLHEVTRIDGEGVAGEEEIRGDAAERSSEE
jgi:hypothetical protein